MMLKGISSNVLFLLHRKSSMSTILKDSLRGDPTFKRLFPLFLECSHLGYMQNALYQKVLLEASTWVSDDTKPHFERGAG